MMIEDDSMGEFYVLALESTSKLFHLLRGAELILMEEGEKVRNSVYNANSPSRLLVRLASHQHNWRHTLEEEYGPEGRLTQLAYVGWVAEVSGHWEASRAKSPNIKRKGKPGWGAKVPLMGDFVKMRNDLIHHQAVASHDNTGKCEVLKWFTPGDQMVFALDHVIEFLHQSGMLYRDVLCHGINKSAHWFLQKGIPPRSGIPRAVSFKADLDEHQVKGKKVNILGLSVAYEDGVTGGSILQEIASGQDYRGDLEFYRSGRLDPNGRVIILPDGRTIEVWAMYGDYLQILRDGGQPPAVSPWFEIA